MPFLPSVDESKEKKAIDSEAMPSNIEVDNETANTESETKSSDGSMTSRLIRLVGSSESSH